MVMWPSTRRSPALALWSLLALSVSCAAQITVVPSASTNAIAPVSSDQSLVLVLSNDPPSYVLTRVEILPFTDAGRTQLPVSHLHPVPGVRPQQLAFRKRWKLTERLLICRMTAYTASS